MYPLDQGLWGPTVRITHLRDELAHRVKLDLISGYRGARRVELARYAVSGRMRGLAGIYVESATFLPAEADIAFLGLARSLRIPVLTYVRDAYQLFREYYPLDTVRRRVAARAFLPAIRLLGRVSSSIAYPSRGLARAVSGTDDGAVLIPPGSPAPVDVPRQHGANRLLFVGNGRVDSQGAQRLIRAVRLARERGADVELTMVSRPGEEAEHPRPPWLRVLNAEGAAIEALLPEVRATVIPRPRGAYNDLALPVKLFDYLALGRPLLVTACTEQAGIVVEADAGLVMGDSEEAMADGVLRIASADDGTLDRWTEHAKAAARKHSWGARAAIILETLGISS